VRLRIITIAVALVAALAAGCGSDEEGKQLPSQDATDLLRQLDSIQSRFDVANGAACGDITDGDDPNTTVVQQTLDSLPADVDADLRDALQDSFNHLFDLVQQECGEAGQQTDTATETTDTATETTTTETTETQTTETTTTPTETTETQTTPTTTTPGNGGGNGQGNGNGNGNGNGTGGGAAGPEGDG